MEEGEGATQGRVVEVRSRCVPRRAQCARMLATIVASSFASIKQMRLARSPWHPQDSLQLAVAHPQAAHATMPGIRGIRLNL